MFIWEILKLYTGRSAAYSPLLLPTERGPGREWEYPQQQLWYLREPRPPGAAPLG